MEKQIIIAIDNAILVVDFTDNTITGDTFTVRNVLKGWGLKWDSDNRAWTGNRDKLKELCYCYKLKQFTKFLKKFIKNLFTFCKMYSTIYL